MPVTPVTSWDKPLNTAIANPASRLTQGLRLLGLLLLLAQGATTILLVFPWCHSPRRLALRQRWSARMLWVLGIRLEARLAHMQPGTLLVANHISWLDIFAINAVSPAAFVAKDDILSWPLFGWLAARNETLFLRRGSRGHARQINAEIAELLETGRHVAVFPEGTTTNGLKVQHFHGALLQPALSADRQVQPLALSYWERGQRSLAARYDGEISLGQCLIAILRCRELQVRLDYLPPLGGAGQDRRSVSQAARQQIVDCLGLSDGATSAAATALSATP